MNALMFLKLYALTIPIFFVIDLIWLGLIAKPFYRRHLSSLLADQVNWGAAAVFYLVYIAGILFFAVRPAIQAQSWQTALFQGALFGFITYATYDLTNLATLKNWPLAVTLVDLAWGTVLCTLVASASYAVSTWVR